MDGALMSKTLRILLAALLLFVCAETSFADTHVASTCSDTDVMTAYSARVATCRNR
jgi:hypothetical protein